MSLQRERLATLEIAFSPSAPISKKDFFHGRISQIEAVIGGINERGQHIVVYGERGVGKTSFANIIGNDLVNVFPVKITCNRTDTFKQLWDKAFTKVRFQKLVSGIGFNPEQREESYQLDLFLPDQIDISALDVQLILENVTANLLFIFDEYDSVVDLATTTKMADTIKSLSDNAPNVTCMLVGIGENVAELVGQHPSIGRCLRQVQLPRMSLNEMGAILCKGFDYLGLKYDGDVIKSIARYAMGFPHFAHLLGKAFARAAIEKDTDIISLDFLPGVLGSSVSRVDESIRRDYQQATISPNDGSRFEKVLWACANAKTDQHLTFRARDAAEAFQRITGERTRVNAITYYLGKLSTTDRNLVLEKVGNANQMKYRFKSPLMHAYVRLKHQAHEQAVRECEEELR